MELQNKSHFKNHYFQENHNYEGTDAFAEATSQNAAASIQARAWEMSKNVQQKSWNAELHKKC